MEDSAGLAAPLPLEFDEEAAAGRPLKRCRILPPSNRAPGVSENANESITSDSSSTGTMAAPVVARSNYDHQTCSDADVPGQIASDTAAADVRMTSAGAGNEMERSADVESAAAVPSSATSDVDCTAPTLFDVHEGLGSVEADRTTLALTPKRTFPCRMCGLGLSSASNRLRHERAKHKAEVAAAAPMRPSTRGPANSTTSSATSVHVHSGVKRTIANMQRIVERSPRTNAFASSSSSCEDESERDEEEDDMELQRFAAAVMVARPSDFPVHSDDSLSASPTAPERDQSSEERSDESRVSGNTSPSEDGSSVSDGGVRGMPLLFSEEALQAGCLPFLQWLASPPLTHVEALVKKRGRITTLEQLHPVKRNLRFMFILLAEIGLADKVDLQIFTRLDVCQALFTALGERRVGAGRFHTIFLLVKKILISLSSQESMKRREYCPPTAHESFLFVDAACAENGQKRKIEARNRALLGVQATQQLLGANSLRQPPQPFRVPTTWSSSTASSSGSSAGSRSPPIASTQPVAAAATASPSSPTPSCNELTPAELKQVTRYCLHNLRECIKSPGSVGGNAGQGVRDRWFSALLVTATLCLGLAPRSQVLRQLRIGSSLTKHEDDGRYWVKLIGEMTKSAKPILFSLPADLTPIYDFYIETVRPRLLAPANADRPATHDFVFTKRDGSPRTEFSSSCTNAVTIAAISRPVNCHAFRGAVVVAFYENTAATQSQMNVLADIMGHDPITARAFYYRPQFSKAAVHTNDKMTQFLLHD